MEKLIVAALRPVLAALLAGSVFVQTVMVWLLSRDLDEADAALGEERTPIVILTVLGIATVQVVLVCVWRLVTMWRRATLFSPAAFRYVDVVIGAVVAAAAVVVALAFILAPGEAVAPGVILLMGGGIVGVLGIALIGIVLRMLLAQAIARDVVAARLKAELDEVI